MNVEQELDWNRERDGKMVDYATGPDEEPVAHLWVEGE